MMRRILCILLALSLLMCTAWAEDASTAGIAEAIDRAVAQVEEVFNHPSEEGGVEQTSWMDDRTGGAYTLEAYARMEDAQARMEELDGTDAFRVLQYVLIPDGPADKETLDAYHAALTSAANVDYVVNRNTKKFHSPDCFSVPEIKNSNREDFIGERDELVDQGYKPCKRCNP